MTGDRSIAAPDGRLQAGGGGGQLLARSPAVRGVIWTAVAKRWSRQREHVSFGGQVDRQSRLEEQAGATERRRQRSVVWVCAVVAITGRRDVDHRHRNDRSLRPGGAGSVAAAQTGIPGGGGGGASEVHDPARCTAHHDHERHAGSPTAAVVAVRGGTMLGPGGPGGDPNPAQDAGIGRERHAQRWRAGGTGFASDPPSIMKLSGGGGGGGGAEARSGCVLAGPPRDQSAPVARSDVAVHILQSPNVSRWRSKTRDHSTNVTV